VGGTSAIPGVCDDPLDGFRDLATDLVRFGSVFLAGTTRGVCSACHESRAYPSAARVCRALPWPSPCSAGPGAPQDATGAERCAVSVGPVDRMFATPPDSPGQCEPGLSTTDREIHVSVTVPSSHPGRREARPADRTSRPLHRLLRCRQRRALPSKDSSRAGPPASCRPFPRRSPW